MVHYLATDGSGHQCSEQVMSRDSGRDMVVEMERRVLRIPADGTYITVAADQPMERATPRAYGKGVSGCWSRRELISCGICW